MALKLPPFLISKQLHKWVSLNSFFSSISCAAHTQNVPEADQNPPVSAEFEATIRFLKKNVHPDRLITVLDSTNDLDSAVKIFKWASVQNRFCQTADAYSRMILKLGLAGNLQEMELFVHKMMKAACLGTDESCVLLIESFCQNGKVQEALLVFEIMSLAKYRPSISTCNVLLSTLVKERGDFQSVVFVYKEMVKAGIFPSVDTLNFLIEALCGTGRIDAALEQFRRMKKKGCSPNSRTFELVIGGICMQNRVDILTKILDEMFEAGCTLDHDFCNNFIPLFCRVNRLDEGLRLFRMMRGSDLLPDLSVYSALIGCFCENLWLDDGVNLLSEMIDTGLMPSANMYVDIVNGFCKLGKFSEAMMFLDEKSVFETAAYNSLLEGYCAAGRFFEANGFLWKMVEMGMCDNLSWNILIRRLGEEGHIGKCFEVLNRMIVCSYMPDDATHSALIIGHCKICKHANAVDLFRLVRLKEWCLDSATYAELIDGLCHTEKIQEAAEVFQYMSGKGCSLSTLSFNLLIEWICLMGKVDEAIKLRSFAFSSRTSSNPVTYTTIMLALCKLNRSKDILVLLSQMLVEGCTLDATVYSILIHGLCAQNRIKDAALLFDQMVSDGFVLDSETLSKLLSSLANHSQVHMVTDSLNKIPSEVLSPSIYNLVVNGLWKEGHKSEACKFLDCMLEKGWVPDTITHGLLIGNADREGMDGLPFEDAGLHDKVSNILAEGLDELS
ncbi:pentatricopeptide repeat-containing protein At1g63330-like isoform X1 [Magnolia sinica]|uniref:pentatricopeptide repeat-containing protein At1g63330-like isoform X1 n=2 Tax=Magnolia sinica TaxID=86752 RepID=UPI0026591AEB|nr:pentatricopeptide repeat-containing protein At1g63330-like isoform X1 [Magnolia sinica]XP_058097848.1 pentatricopeptide repeat-containing protein At1g63330-like isoform X1 [Magnolia sinica]XP_058097849.1 pentatricopeptide repeat-containing protein At1g63330-like isoform X1 [Magnolia sinica]XP_058097850.1 pentatricopeptide repeat-containing protein At1g63330-like isoform X1 [Magnolia sinica]XP_058097851.1 pentatricopeptide repeat-containing protein At1g63330-like isoform X1 [Magnolia sinica]